jgi:hypothetical protein
MTRQVRPLPPEACQALLAWLAAPRAPAPEPGRYVQDPLPGMEAGS